MFAAMLLMPEALFKEKYFDFQTTKGRLDNQESKRLLSEAFNVSKEAASNRMKTLGLA
jgi:Zn-dependent peptidase ImmA (M78 family)